MTDPKKAVKVTVLPAGHPLLRNLNIGQQQHVVIRPQQQQQHVVVQQPQLVVRPQQLVQQQQQQPIIYQVRQPGQQQIIIRQQTPTSQLRPQQVVIRSSGVQQQQQNITNNGQQFVVKTNNIPQSAQIKLSPGSDGQIKLTPQQLAAITGGTTSINNGQQQFVIKQQQPIAVRKQAPPQQILIKTSQQHSHDSKSNLVQKSGSPIKSVVVTGLVTTKSFTTVAGSTQPVVTYIKQNTSLSPAKMQTNSLVKTGPQIITVKPELLNKKTLVPVARSHISKQSVVSPGLVTSHPGNVVRLTPGQVTSLRAAPGLTSGPPLPTQPVPSAIRTLQPVSSSQLLRGLTPVSRGNNVLTTPNIMTPVSAPPGLRTLTPVSPLSLPASLRGLTPVSPRQVTVRPGVSLLSPPRTIQPKVPPATSAAAPAVVEALQLVTADGRLITAEGLQLLSPSGAVVEAKSLLRNLSSPLASPNKSPVKLPTSELDTAQLISSIQTPVPLSVKTQANLATSQPPASIFSGSLQPLVSLPSSDSPPPLQVVPPQIKLPTSPLKDTKDLLLRTKVQSRDPMLTRAVSPSQILPPPASVVQRSLKNSTNISDLLPTQPLLPSEINSCLNPVKSLTKSFDSKPSSSNLHKPVKPKFKSKKESHRAKVQKLEARLNCQPILSVINKKLSNNNELYLNDSEVEKDYLTCVERETRGEELTKAMAAAENKYYDIHNLCRYVDFTNFASDDEALDSLNESLDETYLHDMMKKHIKRKKRKKFLLSAENDVDTSLSMKKYLKGRGRGRPSKAPCGQEAGADQSKNRRQRLWVSIMKKEVNKAGKARSYNIKEKLGNAKRLAAACMRVQRLRAMESQRSMKEAFWRAKRLTREMQAAWRKQEREEKQKNKAKEKAAQEQRKHDIELLEAKRQQRKLNFLITQTELYAHFMAGKLGEKSPDKVVEAEKRILSQLDSDITDERLRDLDSYDAEATKAAARQTARVAAKKTEYLASNFDQKCGADTLLTMSEAAETAGDRPQPGIFQVHLFVRCRFHSERTLLMGGYIVNCINIEVPTLTPFSLHLSKTKCVSLRTLEQH